MPPPPKVGSSPRPLPKPSISKGAPATANQAAEKPAVGGKAKKATAEVKPETARDLANSDTRWDTALKASQRNPISDAAGNADVICGAASVVSALVMQSGTPEAAAANAKALKTAYDLTDAEKRLPPSVDKQALAQAFEHFGAGKPSLTDLHLLQQAAYAIGRTHAGSSADGLDRLDLMLMVSELKGRGATLGPETRFTQVQKGKGGSHWVANSGGAGINTDPQAPVTAGNQQPKGEDWRAEVSVSQEGKVLLKTRDINEQHAKRGLGWTLEIVPVGNDVARAVKNGSHLDQLKKQGANIPKDPKPL